MNEKVIRMNTISAMERLPIKPTFWRIIQNIDHSFSLDATYEHYEKNQWVGIMTARNEKKIYKSISSVMNDIQKIDQSPICQFLFTHFELEKSI